MKNKGFTLVELLAVIAILMLLITVITPKVIKQLNTSEDVTQKEQINTLINIAKIYTEENTEKLPEKNSVSVVTVQELKESGLINKKQILDPKTNEELTGCIKIKDENNKYKYEYNEDNCNNLITVTFDPQGGQLDQTSKNVIPNETYGILPTPTREGYTFMGWNGKNKLAIPVKNTTAEETRNMTLDKMFFINSGNYTYTFEVSNATQWREAFIMKNSNGENLSENDYKPNSSFYFSEPYGGIWLLGTNATSTPRSYEITIKEGCYLYFALMFSDTPETIIVTNAQLEEGSVSTPYEPYYITSDTTVVQENNHTLKAIWQANE